MRGNVPTLAGTVWCIRDKRQRAIRSGWCVRSCIGAGMRPLGRDWLSIHLPHPTNGSIVQRYEEQILAVLLHVIGFGFAAD